MSEDRRALDREFREFMQESLRDRAELRRMLGENTTITKQVADLLTSFHVLAAVAKWIAAIGAAILALKHAPEWFR